MDIEQKVHKHQKEANRRRMEVDKGRIKVHGRETKLWRMTTNGDIDGWQ